MLNNYMLLVGFIVGFAIAVLSEPFLVDYLDDLLMWYKSKHQKITARPKQNYTQFFKSPIKINAKD